MKRGLVCILFCCVSVVLAEAKHVAASRIDVRTVNTPNVMLQLSHASMEVDYGRNIYNLRFSIKNTGAAAVKPVCVRLLAVTADGHIKSGEKFCEENLV